MLTFIAVPVAGDHPPLPTDYCHWSMHELAINEPLCNLEGDRANGLKLVIDTHGGNCLACHQMPIPEETLHGTVGPPLHGLAARMTEGQIRAHLVDQRRFNPNSVMPGFYHDPRLASRVADEYWGKTILTAQQVEDIVAYLKTLR